MKKLFESVGLITLVALSFFYTEKTVNVVKEYDDIMINIKQIKEEVKISPINATIKNNTIIPGIKGKTINTNKSYNKMKQYGKFDSSLLVYEKIKPDISLTKNLDKYIIKGNEQKQMISLIFIVKNNDEIEPILEILENKKIKATFFIDSNWLEKQENTLIKIIKKKHTVGNLGLDGSYIDSNTSWLDYKIKTAINKKTGYCYSEKKNKKTLQLCAGYHNYTIIPNIIITKNPLIEIKEKITPGSLISFPVNKEVTNQLGILIEYVKSKGYKLDSLENHLQE